MPTSLGMVDSRKDLELWFLCNKIQEEITILEVAGPLMLIMMNTIMLQDSRTPDRTNTRDQALQVVGAVEKAVLPKCRRAQFGMSSMMRLQPRKLSQEEEVPKAIRNSLRQFMMKMRSTKNSIRSRKIGKLYIPRKKMKVNPSLILLLLGKINKAGIGNKAPTIVAGEAHPIMHIVVDGMITTTTITTAAAIIVIIIMAVVAINLSLEIHHKNKVEATMTGMMSLIRQSSHQKLRTINIQSQKLPTEL